jgi:hypothetical protein
MKQSLNDRRQCAVQSMQRHIIMITDHMSAIALMISQKREIARDLATWREQAGAGELA